MIGQSFAPLGDPTQQRTSGMSQQDGPQQAIKILNLRMPKILGASAPAPPALLNSPGSGGLPEQGGGANSIIDAILRAVMGGYTPPQQQGSGMPRMEGAPQPPLPNVPPPAVHYQPNPGGTAGPNPPDREPREDRENRRGKTGQDNFPFR